MSSSLPNRVQVFSEELHFDSETDMIEHIALSVGPDEQVGIMAGHFMLCYDLTADALLPMIWQDLEDAELIARAKQFAGDYPVRSFRYGLQLLKALHTQGARSEVILLINDHMYQTNEFQPAPVEWFHGRGGELRRAFYRHNDQLPLSLEALLFKEGLDYSYICDNSVDERSKTDTLPRKTFYFSEQMLRNKFSDYTKDRLLTSKCFTELRRNDGIQELVFLGANNAADNPLYMTEKGSCGCSGEIIQFIHELSRRHKFTELVLLVPDECALQVIGGAIAGLHSVNLELRQNLKKVSVVFGIGGAGQKDMSCEEKHITVSQHELI